MDLLGKDHLMLMEGEEEELLDMAYPRLEFVGRRSLHHLVGLFLVFVLCYDLLQIEQHFLLFVEFVNVFEIEFYLYFQFSFQINFTF